MLPADEARKVNLIEVLLEDARENGLHVEEPPINAAREWTEDRILNHFKSFQIRGNSRSSLPLPGRSHETFKAPDTATFTKWFPGLTRSQTKCQEPKLRVLCFHSAGNAEDMYTSEGTGARKAVSPLLEWCRQNDAEVLAVQLPGRLARMGEPSCGTAQGVAEALLPVVGHLVQDEYVPYVVVSHSMGCYCAYEFLLLCRSKGLPMPLVWFLSAMCHPDLPAPQRPWRQQRTLSEEEFKEECRKWDINELVFSEGMWPMYQRMLRDDFRIFDEYVPSHVLARRLQQPFDFPIIAFYGTQDRRVQKYMVEGWRKFTTGDFQVLEVAGNHLWPLQKEPKAVWLQHIVDWLDTLINEHHGAC